MPSANRNSLTPSFPILIPLIFLFAVVRTFNTMLNKIGDSGHPYFKPDISGFVNGFTLIRIILAMDFLDSYYCIEDGSFNISFAKSFDH